MALMPKRVKYRRQQRGSWANSATRGVTLAFGEYGLKALARGWLTATEIEACRVAINRHMQRKGRLWIRVFPHKPITKKPIETRMGKGKGDTVGWVAVVRPGTMLFELGGIDDHTARTALGLAADKLSMRTCLVARH